MNDRRRQQQLRVTTGHLKVALGTHKHLRRAVSVEAKPLITLTSVAVTAGGFLAQLANMGADYIFEAIANISIEVRDVTLVRMEIQLPWLLIYFLHSSFRPWLLLSFRP